MDSDVSPSSWRAFFMPKDRCLKCGGLVIEDEEMKLRREKAMKKGHHDLWRTYRCVNCGKRFFR